jgi:hypothetical protein
MSDALNIKRRQIQDEEDKTTTKLETDTRHNNNHGIFKLNKRIPYPLQQHARTAAVGLHSH